MLDWKSIGGRHQLVSQYRLIHDDRLFDNEYNEY